MPDIVPGRGGRLKGTVSRSSRCSQVTLTTNMPTLVCPAAPPRAQPSVTWIIFTPITPYNVSTLVCLVRRTPQGSAKRDLENELAAIARQVRGGSRLIGKGCSPDKVQQ